MIIIIFIMIIRLLKIIIKKFENIYNNDSGLLVHDPVSIIDEANFYLATVASTDGSGQETRQYRSIVVNINK